MFGRTIERDNDKRLPETTEKGLWDAKKRKKSSREQRRQRSGIERVRTDDYRSRVRKPNGRSHKPKRGNEGKPFQAVHGGKSIEKGWAKKRGGPQIQKRE